ncbi:hypothetical protein ACQV2S_00915 [Facklamia sp. P13064]|uniref:hypothetical protein n=1 Tax=unclassified Facklamia TaxID=2622293 RepID=UPI003D181684
MKGYNIKPYLKSLLYMSGGYLLALCVIYFFKGEIVGAIPTYLGIMVGAQFFVWSQEKNKDEK